MGARAPARADRRALPPRERLVRQLHPADHRGLRGAERRRPGRAPAARRPLVSHSVDAAGRRHRFRRRGEERRQRLRARLVRCLAEGRPLRAGRAAAGARLRHGREPLARCRRVAARRRGFRALVPPQRWPRQLAERGRHPRTGRRPATSRRTSSSTTPSIRCRAWAAIPAACRRWHPWGRWTSARSSTGTTCWSTRRAAGCALYFAAGFVTARLSAATSAADTDFTVKLCDVEPDGRSINLFEGVIRGRFRESRKARGAAGAPPGLRVRHRCRRDLPPLPRRPPRAGRGVEQQLPGLRPQPQHRRADRGRARLRPAARAPDRVPRCRPSRRSSTCRWSGARSRPEEETSRMADDRTHLTPASEAWMSGRPASAAVRAGDLVFLSGQGERDRRRRGDGRGRSGGAGAERLRPRAARCWRPPAPASTTCST